MRSDGLVAKKILGLSSTPAKCVHLLQLSELFDKEDKELHGHKHGLLRISLHI